MRSGRALAGISSVMKTSGKSKTAIYHPPKAGMPYLVVTVSRDGVAATAVETKQEARVLASSKSWVVDVVDATDLQPMSLA